MEFQGKPGTNESDPLSKLITLSKAVTEHYNADSKMVNPSISVSWSMDTNEFTIKIINDDEVVDSAFNPDFAMALDDVINAWLHRVAPTMAMKSLIEKVQKNG